MDERLRRSTRAASTDPAELARAVAEHLRAGDRGGGARLVRERLDEAGPALDLLEPPPVGATTFAALRVPGGERLKLRAWTSNERALWVEDSEAGLVRWPLDGAAPTRHLVPPPAVTGMVRGLSAPAGPLVVARYSVVAPSPDETRLALIGLVLGGQGVVWLTADLADGRVTQGPVVRVKEDWGARLCWYDGRVVGHGDGTALGWTPGGAHQELGRATTLEVAEGTCVGRRRKELLFLRPGREPVVVPYPVDPLPKGWDGLVAVVGERALVVHQDMHQVILLGPGGELTRRELPATRVRRSGMGRPGNLVAVRPCPSGRVVALRYMQTPVVVLLDLRDGSHADVPLGVWPEDPMLWSPSGQTLAAGTKEGIFLISAT